MAQPNPGQSTLWRTIFLLILLVGVAIILLGYYYFEGETIVAVGGAGCLVLYLLARTAPEIAARLAGRRRKKDGEPARILDTSSRMKSILEGLGPEYYFIKDIPCPYGLISYLVFNRWRGVFLLVVEVIEGEVKTEDGKVLVNARPAKVDFPARALRYAHWCKNEMIKLIGTRPWITPMVVFTHANVVADQPINGVMLVNTSYLPVALQKTGGAVSSNSEVWEFRMKIEQGLATSS